MSSLLEGGGCELASRRREFSPKEEFSMDLDQMLTAAANYGFPMLVSCYLLVRMENKIDKLCANIDALTRVIAAAK